jgi:IstB-like ATP binding protein
MRHILGRIGYVAHGADQPPAPERLAHQALWHPKMLGDHAMMIAAIDRLVHHAIIFEMNVESYRRRGALDRKDRAAAIKKPRETAPA